MTTNTTPRKRGRPTKKEVMRRPDSRCPATSKQTGQQCGKPAGFGTPHKGEGVCKFHGGLTPIPTTIVSEYSLESKIQAYQDDPAIFDLRREIGTLRALLQIETEKYDEATPAMKDASLSKISYLIASISKSAKDFFGLMRAGQYVMTVAQARQVREAIKDILMDEAGRLAKLLEPAMPTLGVEIETWRMRVASRLQTEVNLYEEESTVED